MSSRRYDVAAAVPSGASKEQFRVMLQRLVADRFRLVTHMETREMRGFDLTPHDRAKLRAAAPADAGPEPEGRRRTDGEGYPILEHPGIAVMEGQRGGAVVSFVTAKAQPVSALADLIAREFRLPIVDKTALTGLYDFRVEFAPQPPGALPPASPDALVDTPDTSAPNLTTALQQQLGLRLVSTKVRVPVLVVDSAEQVPAGN